ncbi:MAG: HypC/HybG/HupF family hydrogenase formation chaperone [bacterium]
MRKQDSAPNLDRASGMSCSVDQYGCCATCADEAAPVLISRVVDGQNAIGRLNDTEIEVDISLIEKVCPGDVVLVHAGVALAQIDEDD